MKIEEFKVTIIKEKGFFVAKLEFEDGKEMATQGTNIFECYDMMSDILKEREKSELNLEREENED